MEGIMAEMQRQVGKLLTVGIVEDVKGNLVKVRIGKNVTPYVPYSALRAGDIRIYCPPSVGEQVIVMSQGGSYENAVVGMSAFCDAIPEPSEGKCLFIDAYGTTIKIDKGGVEIVAGVTKIQGNVEINGDVSVSGKVEAQGEVTSSVDVKGGGISLIGHVHGGVTSGGSMTGVGV